MLTVSVAKPAKPRLKGRYIFGIVLVYALISLFFANLWSELLNKWYGQWPGFTFGVIFGIPSLVVTTGTALGMLCLALYAISLGRFPAWIEAVSIRSVWSRMGIGLATVLLLVVVAGFVLGVVLRKP